MRPDRLVPSVGGYWGAMPSSHLGGADDGIGYIVLGTLLWPGSPRLAPVDGRARWGGRRVGEWNHFSAAAR